MEGPGGERSPLVTARPYPRRIGFQSPLRKDVSWGGHARILDALTRHDGADAQEAMSRHLSDVVGAVVDEGAAPPPATR